MKERKVRQEGCVKLGVPCEDNDQALSSAFGFWLFPRDVFGPIPSASPQIRTIGRNRHSDQSGIWRFRRAWDLLEHKPELCLQYLPKAPCYELDGNEGLRDEEPQSSRRKHRIRKRFPPVGKFDSDDLREVLET